MFRTTIDTSDLERKFRSLDLLQIRFDIGDAIAEEAVLPMFRANPPQTNAKQPFVSAKQRRYFFWALRKGKLDVPYRRTGAINALWEVTTANDGSTRVASKRKNAKYVIGLRKEQSRYHARNWKSVEDVAAEVEAGPAGPIAERVLNSAIQKAGLA